jgi:hypothetical protein
MLPWVLASLPNLMQKWVPGVPFCQENAKERGNMFDFLNLLGKMSFCLIFYITFVSKE